MKHFETIIVVRANILANDTVEAAQLARESMIVNQPVHLNRCEVLDVTLITEPEVTADGQEEEEEETQVVLRHI